MSSKANPNIALAEVEPGKEYVNQRPVHRLTLLIGAQALTAPTMDSNLRGMQHRDMYGNIISMELPAGARAGADRTTADPDRSNPTRSRLERPLDTIRSFEAAVDGKYGSVGSYNGRFPRLILLHTVTDTSADTPGPSRPASTYLGTNTPLPRARSSFGIYSPRTLLPLFP